jgi:hypothetical protein
MFLQILVPLCFIIAISSTPFARDGYKPTANFNQCYGWLQNQNEASLKFLFTNHTLYGDPSRRFLTVLGCYKLCGTGFQPWPILEVLDRFSLWVFPVVILLTYLNIAPLGGLNYLAVVIHAAGDPIDSLWSILTRFEVNRRLVKVAEVTFQNQEDHEMTVPLARKRVSTEEIIEEGQIEPSGISSEDNAAQTRGIFSRVRTSIQYRCQSRVSTKSDHIGTIWASYEEIGWQDATSQFRAKGESVGITNSEWIHIREASYQLSSRRKGSLTSTFIPIGSLAIAIAFAIIKTINQIDQSNTRLANETAHTIAVVCLLFIFIPLVAFSGSIGTVTRVTAAVESINKLRNNLGLEADTDTGTGIGILFPCLVMPSERTCSKCFHHTDGLAVNKSTNDKNSASSHELSQKAQSENASHASDDQDSEKQDSKVHYKCIDINSWPSMASYMGMNSIWRICKHLRKPLNTNSDSLRKTHFWRRHFFPDHLKTSERSQGALLFLSFCFVVAGAGVPAAFLSMTNRATVTLLGVGCRSLSWLTILGCWLLSFADDWHLRRSFSHKGIFFWLHKNPKGLWTHTIAKDSFCVIIIVVLIGVQQTGLYNGCWCRASFHPFMNLQPYDDWEWHRAKVLWSSIPSSFFLFHLLIIVWIISVGGTATSPVNKSQDTLQANKRVIDKDGKEIATCSVNKSEDQLQTELRDIQKSRKESATSSINKSDDITHANLMDRERI